MTSKTSTPAQPAQPGNELYFTSGTKRAARIGRTMVVVTEGARITITLPARDGEPTRVGVVVTSENVVVNKSTRKAARTTENVEPAPVAEPQAAAKPAARKPAAAKAPARKPAAAAAK